MMNADIDRKYRLKCLRLALGAGDPDSEISADETVKKAETFFRYVMEGPRTNGNVAVVGKETI
jgi:hypothetical protein